MELVFETYWNTVKRANRLATLGKMCIEILSVFYSILEEYFMETVNLRLS